MNGKIISRSHKHSFWKRSIKCKCNLYSNLILYPNMLPTVLRSFYVSFFGRRCFSFTEVCQGHRKRVHAMCRGQGDHQYFTVRVQLIWSGYRCSVGGSTEHQMPFPACLVLEAGRDDICRAWRLLQSEGGKEGGLSESNLCQHKWDPILKTS